MRLNESISSVYESVFVNSCLIFLSTAKNNFSYREIHDQ